MERPRHVRRVLPRRAGRSTSRRLPRQSSVAAPPDTLGCHDLVAGRVHLGPAARQPELQLLPVRRLLLQRTSATGASRARSRCSGTRATPGPSIDGPKTNDTFANNPCRNAWTTIQVRQVGRDASTSAATRQLTVEQNSTVEISGRERSGQNIAVQALETPSGRTPSTIRGDQRIITTGPGSNKQLSIQGLVWAPYAALEFDLISNDAVAALDWWCSRERTQRRRVGERQQLPHPCRHQACQQGAEPHDHGHSPNGQGSTSVKSVVTVQVDKGAKSYAIDSRRVLGLTPEGSSSPPPPPPPTPTVRLAPPPVPAPTTGPCNETRSSGPNDFGDSDWTAEYWNLAVLHRVDAPGGPVQPAPGRRPSVVEDRRILRHEFSRARCGQRRLLRGRFTKTINVGTACSVTLRAGSPTMVCASGSTARP